MPKKIVSATTIGQGVRTAGSISGDFIAQPIVEEMMFIAPFQTPFLNYLFLNESVKWEQCNHLQGLCEIAERELVPNMDTITTTGTAGSATITITPEEPNLYVVGKSIMFEETGETGIVSSVTSTTFTALRDLSSSGATQTWTTAPTNGTNIHILGEAHGENDNPPESVFVNPYMRKTRVQLFQKTIKFTDMLIASTKAGGTRGGNYWVHENRDKAASMKIDMENALWMNANHFVRTTDNKVVTKTEGVIYQIENNGGVVLPYGSSADRTDIKEFLRLSKYGSKKKTFFVGDDLANDVEDAIEDKYSNTQSISKYGAIAGDDTINILRWRTNNLIVDIIRNPQWNGKFSKYGVMLDDNYLIGYYYAPDNKGSRKFRVELGLQANGQPREEAQYLAHIGVGVACAPCHGVMKP